jgi:hypothetical protein
MRGILQAAAFRFHHWRLWNTGSPARRTLETSRRYFRENRNFYPVTAIILSGITGRGIALASGAAADVNYSSTDFGAVPATQRGAR